MLVGEFVPDYLFSCVCAELGYRAAGCTLIFIIYTHKSGIDLLISLQESELAYLKSICCIIVYLNERICHPNKIVWGIHTISHVLMHLVLYLLSQIMCVELHSSDLTQSLEWS